MTKPGLIFPALLSLGLLTVANAGCTQRRVTCAPEANDFNVKLTFVQGSKMGTGDCDTRFDGAESVQVFGMQPYFNDPRVSSDGKTSLAIQPFETGNYATNAPNADMPATDTDPNHKPYAFGKFDTQFPNSQDICTVKTLSAAEVQYDKGFTITPSPPDDAGAGDDDGGGDDGATSAADLDGGTDGGTDADVGVATDAAKDAATDAGASNDAGGSTDVGASTDAGGGDDGGMCVPPPPGDDTAPQVFDPIHVKYDFANLRFFVNAALTGSMVAGELTYTQFNGAATCVAKYTFRGIAPSVACSDDCGKPSNDLCHDPQNGIPQPDWDTEGDKPTFKNKNAIYSLCDTDSQQCVLDPGDTHIPQ
ncbi:MAG TPA: hypothetical protein VH374_08535 [Polyangia bacterium]|nr:hypothetical protein [Polyangia bacterium]